MDDLNEHRETYARSMGFPSWVTLEKDYNDRGVRIKLSLPAAQHGPVCRKRLAERVVVKTDEAA